MQVEPPTLALGVPTIWMGLIQAYDRSLVEQPGPLEAAGRDALARRRRGGSGSADPRFRQARHLDHPGLGDDRDVAARDGLVPAPGSAGARRRRALSPRRDGRRPGAAGRRARARRRRQERAVGRQERRRDPGARPVHHRLVPPRRAERRQVHRRRLAPHRRRRGDGRARLRPHHRPHQGPDQVGRRVDLVGRPRERADGASAGRRGGGDRDPRPEVERAAAGVHRLEAGRRDRSRRRRRRRSASTSSPIPSPSGSCPSATR